MKRLTTPPVQGTPRDPVKAGEGFPDASRLQVMMLMKRLCLKSPNLQMLLHILPVRRSCLGETAWLAHHRAVQAAR